MEVVLERLDKMDAKLDILLDRGGVCENECQRMGQHIHFVEGAYNVLRSPLDLICQGVQRFRTSTTASLPQLTEYEPDYDSSSLD
jgi:hypothetical protein